MVSCCYLDGPGVVVVVGDVEGVETGQMGDLALRGVMTNIAVIIRVTTAIMTVNTDHPLH